MTRNRRVVLRARPQGLVTTAMFGIEEAALAELRDGEFLLRVLWLSMDAGTVGRLRAEASYVRSVEIGGVISGGGLGQVVLSRSAAHPIGSYWVGTTGWQEWAILDASDPMLTPVDPSRGPLSLHLGILGISGLTAYFALTRTAGVRAGDVVVVSAGAGGVGTAAGQIARLHGAAAIAITSTEEKAAQLVADHYFDAAVHYRSRDTSALSAALRDACPTGVDVYLDNVGGDIYDAVLSQMRTFGRVIVCGRVALASLENTSIDIGPRDANTILVRRLRKEGFLFTDHLHDASAAKDVLWGWYADQKLRASEHVIEGIERAPEAFTDMLSGAHSGRTLVRIAAD